MDPFQLGLVHPLTFALALAPMCVNIGILVYAVRNLPRDRISALFEAFVVCLIFWQAYDCFVRTSLTAETALFWRRLFYTAQTFAFPTGVHFALAFAGRDKWAESPVVVALLYLPAIFFANVHQEVLVHDPTWGWLQDDVKSSVDARAVMVWGSALSLLNLGLLGLAVRQWKDEPGRQRQARLIFVGLLIPIALGMVFEMIFPAVLHVRQWPVTSTSLSAFSICTVIALTRYKLFDASSGTAVAAVLETMQDALVIATPTGQLLYANHAAAEQFGIDRSQVRAYPIARLFPDDAAWRAFHDGVWRETIAGAPSRAHEAVLRTRDGRVVPSIVSTAPVPVSRWGQPGVLLLAHDVSRLKQVEAELVAAKRVAEEANQSKSSFLANMSHELRTPLNAILGYTELVKEILADDGYDDVTKDMDKIHRAATHLLALINDVLDLSKIEAGRMEVVPEDFDLYELVADVKTMGLPLAERQNNGLQVKCAPDIGRVYLDKVKVKQILLNLLSNACKFTEGGTVTLSVTTRDGDRIEIAVIDTGLGMSPEQLGKLFQRFSQVHTDRGKYGGTGLGLVLCKRFAEMMGGDVTVTSEPGKGSVFTMDVPRRFAPAQG